MPNEKTGRVAFLTGVGASLGASLARRFARGSYALGLVARHSDFLDQLAREVSGAGGRAIAVLADVGEPEEAKSAVAWVRRELGKINLLLHNGEQFRIAADCLARLRSSLSAPGGSRR